LTALFDLMLRQTTVAAQGQSHLPLLSSVAKADEYGLSFPARSWPRQAARWHSHPSCGRWPCLDCSGGYSGVDTGTLRSWAVLASRYSGRRCPTPRQPGVVIRPHIRSVRSHRPRSVGSSLALPFGDCLGGTQPTQVGMLAMRSIANLDAHHNSYIFKRLKTSVAPWRSAYP
jgi:hypothetical protein